MIALCLLLAGCGGTEETKAANVRDRYHDMAGCSMTAVVSCTQEDQRWEATLQCEYIPDGESTVEVLEPETIAGVRAKLSDTDWSLEYEGNVLNIGPLSDEEISPVASLPRLAAGRKPGEVGGGALPAYHRGPERGAGRQNSLHALAAAG